MLYKGGCCSSIVVSIINLALIELFNKNGVSVTDHGSSSVEPERGSSSLKTECGSSSVEPERGSSSLKTECGSSSSSVKKKCDSSSSLEAEHGLDS
ncbi:unnamed protein product [Rotaria sp. Silwood2]|nr:unnamed protein product [Rotaria sp. Silwood2]CAF3440992.1 unnamed protein product [Rotaria sp. Silwood2]CAF4440175.1 unnamed protein product [Rotaria sp. Silwood2]CAF4554451.1 unnamed protein product [Rotaria sp. Silwood2]